MGFTVLTNSQPNETFKEAVEEFHSGNLEGLPRRIVQVAILRALSVGRCDWRYVEQTISDFRSNIPTTYSSFAAMASYARAIAYYGSVDDEPLLERLSTLPLLDPGTPDLILREISLVSRDEALAARRRQKGGAVTRDPNHKALIAAERLIARLKDGDLAAREEFGLLVQVVEAAKSPAQR